MMGAALLAALAAATLVDAVRTEDPAVMLDHMAVLGRTVDLSDAAQLRAAIGPTDGLPTRRSTTSAFAGYTLPAGEVVFNPDAPGGAYLGISLGACMPTAVVRARLRAPEFVQAATKSTVALYEDTPYRARPGTVFTFHEAAPGCTGDFGIRQRAPGA